MSDYLKNFHSLDELRSKFDHTKIFDSFIKGSLVEFLLSHYYEVEANSISKLTPKDKNCMQKLCTILGVEYSQLDMTLTDEEKKKIEILKTFTSDEKILKNFNLVAFNQKELAELLDNGEQDIYLCHNKFSIPLSKPSVTYTGIDNPIIENPFTLEQYKKAGITIKHITLPETVSKEMTEYALTVAKQNGYDDYAENNSPLATYFHNKLKNYERFTHTHLPYDISAATKEFRSEYAAKQALKEYLRKPYDAAAALVNTNSEKCIAITTAEEYYNVICDCFEPVCETLERFFAAKNKSMLYERLINLITESRKTLIAKFCQEIKDNQGYYNMYDFDYFVERVTIEEHDYRTSEGVLRVMEALFSDSIEYTYDDFLGSVYEMEKDINDRLSSFYKVAYNEYLSFIKKIEKIFEESGSTPDINKNEDICDYLKRII